MSTVIAALVIAVVAIGAIVIQHRAPTTGASGAAGTLTAADAPPLTVVGTDPVDQATSVASDTSISVQFSAPVASDSPTPTLTPAVSGAWQLLDPDTFIFVASAPLLPSSTETVTVPGGDQGVRTTTGTTLKKSVTISFTVATGDILRLQQLLGELDYLPVSFVPAGPLDAPQQAAQPQQGTFAWRAPEPASLESLWTVGSANVITKAAVMTFESQNHLTTDGIAGPTVWAKLLGAVAVGAIDTQPYNYVYVVEAATNETATVYSNGTQVFSTPANTGAAGAPTQPGTFPVYVRYTVTTMSGTNPDGSKYVDPGIKWVSYFNGGDALHAYPRASYGFPQSDGCVEMPEAAAATVFPLTPIGTLVTVS
jgi:lipoprotein-anchoring transpeptidase ErfK/SrfK